MRNRRTTGPAPGCPELYYINALAIGDIDIFLALYPLGYLQRLGLITNFICSISYHYFRTENMNYKKNYPENI